MSIKLLFAIALWLGVVLPAAAQKQYDPGAGAGDTEIRIGQTMPYSGAASAYGTIGKTQAAYFRKVNDDGGINGRRPTRSRGTAAASIPGRGPCGWLARRCAASRR